MLKWTSSNGVVAYFSGGLMQAEFALSPCLVKSVAVISKVDFYMKCSFLCQISFEKKKNTQVALFFH